MRYYLLLAAFCISFSLTAQQEIPYGNPNDPTLPKWAQLMYADNADPGKVAAEYQSYYKTHKLVKNKHTQYYKRWMRGITRTPYIDATKDANQTKGGPIWQGIGPFDFDLEAASRSYACGAAHVYGIKKSATSPNTLFCGTATAGVWKSTDNGLNWVCMTKNMQLDYVFTVEIHPTNANLVLFGGAGNVYKSTDGGNNWVITGDANFNADDHDVRDIVFDPVTPTICLMSTDHGYYRSTDSGSNWTEIFSGDFQEIELHPTNHNMVYLIEQTGNKTLFRKSIDNGLTFTTITNGWPNPTGSDEQKRTEIATTPAAPNNVYALCTGVADGGSGLYGIYVSTDMGASWTFRCCGTGPGGVPAPDNFNLMAWDDGGQDDGGQYYYDLALDVSNTNANELHVGAVNHWISTDGGFTFTCPAKWSHSDKIEYVHADIHDIRFFGNELWIVCDGGIFYQSAGNDTIKRRMKGIEGTDFWGFGAATSTDKIMLGGTYHNGTLLKDNNTYLNGWISCMGGDNVRGHVNFANPRKVYHDYGTSVLSGDRTVGLQMGSFPVQPNGSYIIGESSNYEFHPHSQNIIYYGNENILYKSDGNGGGATAIYDFGEKVTSVEIAPTNPNVFYVCTYPGWWDQKHVWKSTNGGQSFTNITPSSATINGDDWVPYDIAVSATDENTVWLARTSQYGGNYPGGMANYRVFKSTNGGGMWNNITTATLANQSITNIEHQAGTNGGVFIGTRNSVFYRNASMADWQEYNSGLPAMVFSVQLFINYRQGLMWNATNRSVYEAPLIEQGPPLAQIAADKFVVDCFDNTVQFADNSAMSAQNAEWQWSFPGGNPSTSTLQNPIVTYSQSGQYNVTLTVTDAFGTSTQTLNTFITYTNTADTVDLVQNFEPATFPGNWQMRSSDGNMSWSVAEVAQDPACSTSKALTAQNYWVNSPGSEAWLISPPISLADIINPSLSYYYAYAEYPGYEDGLRVEISDNCGVNWTTLFEAYADQLTTVAPNTESYSPENCTDWLQKTHDLTAYIGDTVLIRFAAINDYGNNLYLDNVNITGEPNAIEEQAMVGTTIFPNPGNGEFYIRTNEKDIRLTLYSAEGKQVYSSNFTEGTHRFNLNVANGLYLAKIESNKKVKHLKLVVN